MIRLCPGNLGTGTGNGTESGIGIEKKRQQGIVTERGKGRKILIGVESEM